MEIEKETIMKTPLLVMFRAVPSWLVQRGSTNFSFFILFCHSEKTISESDLPIHDDLHRFSKWNKNRPDTTDLTYKKDLINKTKDTLAELTVDISSWKY